MSKNDAVKLFTHKIDEFIEINKSEIINEVNFKDLNYILVNDDEFIKQLVTHFSVNVVNVDFNKIEYSEEARIVYDLNRNPLNRITYKFKVPFEGDVKLLKYRSNKGKFKADTYFAKDNFICFNSLNFDIKPVSRRFSNTIDILKSIIHNINKDYEEWNWQIQNFIEKTVKNRKNILIDFKNFCDKVKISVEEIGEMEFKLGALEALSKIIAETHTGSEITTLFKKAGFPEIVHDGTTKWRFVCATFEEMQNESIEGFYKILKVLEVVCDPQEYILNPELHGDVLEKINRVLCFYEFKFNEDGALIKESKNKNVSNHKNLNSDSNFISKLEIYGSENSSNSVFICHSSKDKSHFVSQFVDKLKKQGITPWYDDSEINGSNLIEKINEAIEKSVCGIIIFSKNLENSKFALREKDSLIHKSIYDEDYKLILIKIDKEVNIPPLINNFQVIEINDLANYDNELIKIVEMISNEISADDNEKINSIILPNCTEEETKIFLGLCDLCLRFGFDAELDPMDILNVSQKYLLNDTFDDLGEKVALSLLNLEKQGYLIDVGGQSGFAFTSKSISFRGFCFYFKNFVEDSQTNYLKLVSAIYEDKKFSLLDLINESKLDRTIVEALIRIFRKQRYVFCENNLTIIDVTSKGKKYFKQVLDKNHVLM